VQLIMCHVHISCLEPENLKHFSGVKFNSFLLSFRRRLVCANVFCKHCTAEPCGNCRRCLRPSSKNKCIMRYLSLKFTQPCQSFLNGFVYFQVLLYNIGIAYFCIKCKIPLVYQTVKIQFFESNIET
jgi:hypothetical protein